MTDEIVKTYWSMQIEWQHDDSEQGAFSWTGWAADFSEAELQARKAMHASYCDEYDVDEETPTDEEAMKLYGGVIYAFEGADIYAAVEVAAHVERRLAVEPVNGDLQYVMDMLRPSDDISWEIHIFAMAKTDEEDVFVLSDSEYPPLPIVHYDAMIMRRTESTGEVETYDEIEFLDFDGANRVDAELQAKYPTAGVEWV